MWIDLVIFSHFSINDYKYLSISTKRNAIGRSIDSTLCQPASIFFIQGL